MPHDFTGNNPLLFTNVSFRLVDIFNNIYYFTISRPLSNDVFLDPFIVS